MVQKIQGAQRDFSFGEIDVALKRSDEHPARKAGLRQMANARILNSGAVQNRSGRRAIFPIIDGWTRIEKFTLSSGNAFKIGFGAGSVNIINSVGVVVFGSTLQGNGGALPWTGANVNQIVFAVPPNTGAGGTIYLTFPGMRPQVITWSSVGIWSIADYTEAVLISGQKRTPFYRLSPQNVTMLPSATSSAITVTFSQPIVVAGMVGTRVRYAGRQILLGSIINASIMNATVIETLPPAQTLTLSSSVGQFAIGDVLDGVGGAQGIIISTPTVQALQLSGLQQLPSVGSTLTGSVSGATGVVINVTGLTFGVSLTTGTAFSNSDVVSGPWGSSTLAGVGPTSLTVQLIQNTVNATGFTGTEQVASPSGSGVVNSVSTTAPQAISVWDDEVMNSFRGFPASCFVDQFRIGFCNFPAIPGGILWSAINSPTDAYANDASSPDNAIFEIAPGKVQVYYVVPGPEGSEFVFCDVALYYIPISTSSPLVPGSVGFTLLSGDGAARVQPRLAQQAILYSNAGQNGINAVIATGSITQPFNTKILAEFHQHLFSNIQCIAAPNADGTFLERYAYVLNGNGSIAVGKYQAESLMGNQPVIGWGPWSGAATVEWIAAWNAEVIFTSTYFGVGICEILDDTQYLDCALSVNAPPASFTPPAGKGPLWFIPGQSVTLMDQVTRAMGTYQIDANGFIIPQNNGGENLEIASLVAGQPWTMTVEPFCPDANPGTDAGQRMMKRRIARFAAYVENSTGFLMARLFSGPITPTSQAKSIPLGTVMNTRRVTTFNQGDNPTLPPPLREEAQRWRPLGRAFDPRVAIIKDTPGPLLIAELGMEATI